MATPQKRRIVEIPDAPTKRRCRRRRVLPTPIPMLRLDPPIDDGYRSDTTVVISDEDFFVEPAINDVVTDSGTGIPATTSDSILTSSDLPFPFEVKTVKRFPLTCDSTHELTYALERQVRDVYRLQTRPGFLDAAVRLRCILASVYVEDTTARAAYCNLFK